ncbi:MAG: Ig-like domain-containing protein, partial [Chloroflexota bacterium]
MKITHRAVGRRSVRSSARFGWTLCLVLLLVSMALSACNLGRRVPTATPVRPVGVTPTAPVAPPPAVSGGAGAGVVAAPAAREVSGMQFRLSAGAEAPMVAERLPVAQGQPLSDEETRALLARLPALEMASEDVQPFRLPPQSLPAPRPGQTITQTFPPAEPAGPPPKVAAGPLRVLRYSPEGEVPLAPYLSVTFDEPMVALTAHADLARQAVPVQLSPEPEGRWRWVGTKTLMFEPTTRFPMATAYQVRLPAGTASATGGKLDQDVTWSFGTPPPAVTATFPGEGPQVRDPLLLVAFDQRIDPTAVLKTIRLTAAGQPYTLELLPTAAVRANESLARLADAAGARRWVAFRPTATLPYNAAVMVEIGPGTPSAEGPRTTDAAHGFRFSTYGPLRVVAHECGWDKECPPMSPWSVRFSNPLDIEAFDPTSVVVAPDLPGIKVSAYGDTVRIQGRSQGRTRYKVTLKQGLRDAFGQALERDETVEFNVTSAQASMATPWEPYVVLDPLAKPTYTVYTINYDTVRVRVYAVSPDDWPAYQRYLREGYRTEGGGTPPGRQVQDAKVATKGQPDALTETALDLSKHLRDGKGHLILLIQPEGGLVSALRRERQPVLRVWVQATGIALDAFVDGEELLAWTSALEDGATRSGAQLKLVPGGQVATTDGSGLARLALG